MNRRPRVDDLRVGRRPFVNSRPRPNLLIRSRAVLARQTKVRLACWDGNGTTPMASLAPSRQRHGGGRTAPPAAEDEAAGSLAHPGRLSHRGRRRGGTLPSGRAAVLVLVLLSCDPDPVLPALVDPAGRAHDRGLRRRSPSGLANQGRHRGAHADRRHLHRERRVRAQLRGSPDRLRGIPAHGGQRCGGEHPAVPGTVQGIPGCIHARLRPGLDLDLWHGRTDTSWS